MFSSILVSLLSNNWSSRTPKNHKGVLWKDNAYKQPTALCSPNKPHHHHMDTL